MSRTIFGHPIRKGTTAEFYPEKMELEEFYETFKNNFEDYYKNMKQLGVDKAIYAEEWFESFLAWSEVENENWQDILALKELLKEN